MYTSYLVKIDDIAVKINLMTTLKKIKEKHVADAYNYLQTIDQYRNELKEIDSSIDYIFIDVLSKSSRRTIGDIFNKRFNGRH